MANYNLVATADFKPFSLQEMLIPFTAYKDAFEKSEEAYSELSDKSDKFKYLSETLPEGSKARQLYEGYANELRTQAEDLAHNGLTMGNRRALTSLKRRYQGEIGRLSQADEALREEQKLRRSMKAQDSSMMFGNDNLSIDDFLDGNNPNLYSISGKEIYARGATTGKAFSSRLINVGEGNMTLGGYYRDLVSENGYSPEVLNKFMQDMSAIPELKASYDNYMEASGANANLSSANRLRATKEWVSGVLDGAIYQENHSPQRDLGVPTWTEKRADARAQDEFNLNATLHGMKKSNGQWVYDKSIDPSYQKAIDLANIKAQGKSGSQGSSSRGSAYDVRNKNVTMIGAKSGTKYKGPDDEDKVIGSTLESLEGARALSGVEYSQLLDNNGNITNEHLRNAIGNGNLSDYEIYVLPAGSTKIDGSGWFWDDKTNEDIYIAIPRESKRAATENGSSVSSSPSSSDADTDIPK